MAAVRAISLPTPETAEVVALLLAGLVGLLGVGLLLVVALAALLTVIALVWRE